jgi:hypothetical protein
MQFRGSWNDGKLAERHCVAGLRRVDWVRLYPDGAHPRAEAVGVGFRLPVTMPIPVSMAARLIAAGTPSVVLHD